MPFFTWKKEFSIGLDDLDSQHKLFLDYLNDCYDKVSQGQHAGIPLKLVNKLKMYGKEHFLYEENLMQFTHFPDLEKHREQHRYFESQISELESSARLGDDAKTAKNILIFMRDWFLNHIIEEDRKLSIHI